MARQFSTEALDTVDQAPSERVQLSWQAGLAHPPQRPCHELDADIAMPSARLQVIGAESGLPLAGASVELCFWPAGSEQALIEVRQTDAEGIIACGYGRGELRVVAWRDSLAAGPAFFDLEDSTLLRETIELRATHAVQGRVLDRSTGLPVAGAEVSFRTFSERDVVLTGADGWFMHPRFPRSGFAEQVHIKAPGFGPSVRYLTIEEDGRWELPATDSSTPGMTGDSHSWLALELIPALSVSGRVLDSSGAPIVGAMVVCEGFFRMLPDVASRDAQSTESDASGVFLLEGLRSDISHGLVLSAEGYGELLLELELSPDRSLVLPEIRMQRESLVAGVVVDHSGVPAEDIQVELIRLDASADPAAEQDAGQGADVAVRIAGHMREQRTDAMGVFLFERSESARYRLVVSREQETLLQIDLGPEQVLAGEGLILSLPASLNTLVGRVRNAPAGTRVEIHRGGLVASVGLDSVGTFRVAGLDLEGPYQVLLRGLSEDSTGIMRSWVGQSSVWAHETPVLQMQLDGAPLQAVLAKIALK